MTLNADTFLGSRRVRARAGVGNAFSRSPAPVSARGGSRQGRADARRRGRDVRYPRVTLDEVRARGAQMIVLPDEPYAFTRGRRGAAARALAAAARVVRVDGKDLFWYGAWTLDAIARLTAQLADA